MTTTGDGPSSAAPNVRQVAWTWTADAALTALGSARTGLSSVEARRRLPSVRASALHRGEDRRALHLLIAQVSAPLVLILIAAGTIAAALGDWLEAAIILTIVFVSTMLGFAQEFRASTAMAALRQRLALSASVLRDGVTVRIPFADIASGDVVKLTAGAVAPADGLLLSAQDLMVSEAALTGESFPVDKHVGVLPAATPVAGRTNMVFLGSSIRSGVADMLVVATGRDTQFGTIAERLRARPSESDFARSMRSLGFLLIRVMFVIVLAVVATNQLLGRPFLESLLFAVALGVGLSPELLPAIMSVTLAAGARRLAGRGVIVRTLDAIENLGGMTVFCTDKTGTLTEGQVRLEATLAPDGAPSAEVAELAWLNAHLETGIENPLDKAIVDALGASRAHLTGPVKVDEIPYDFRRKRLTIVARRAGDAEAVLITKGAFDNVVATCATWRTPAGETRLDAGAREQLSAEFRRHCAAGFRVLAIAEKRVSLAPHYSIGDETDLCFAGWLLFTDPPKPEAAVALTKLSALGVSVKVISGDNRYTVAHAAGLIGLDASRLLTGSEIGAMKEEALWNVASRTTLFAEIEPEAKERIVRALQKAGHSVGFLGDGINDAPALHAADVGISVEGAVDVARESADIVLLSRDLDVLADGVSGGRRTFANTLKYVCIAIAGNFGNMVSMAIASPFLPFLPMTAAQILLNNLLSDLPMLALASDRVSPAQIKQPLRLGARAIQTFMIVFGLISSVFDLLTFGFLVGVMHVAEIEFQSAWFVMSLLTDLAVILVLRTTRPVLRSRPAKLLVWSTLGAACITIVSPYLGPVSGLFGLAPLPAPLLGALACLIAGYLATTEGVKLIFFRHSLDGHSARPALIGGRAAGLQPQTQDHQGDRA